DLIMEIRAAIHRQRLPENAAATIRTQHLQNTVTVAQIGVPCRRIRQYADDHAGFAEPALIARQNIGFDGARRVCRFGGDFSLQAVGGSLGNFLAWSLVSTGYQESAYRKKENQLFHKIEI